MERRMSSVRSRRRSGSGVTPGSSGSCGGRKRRCQRTGSGIGLRKTAISSTRCCGKNRRTNRARRFDTVTAGWTSSDPMMATGTMGAAFRSATLDEPAPAEPLQPVGLTDRLHESGLAFREHTEKMSARQHVVGVGSSGVGGSHLAVHVRDPREHVEDLGAHDANSTRLGGFVEHRQVEDRSVVGQGGAAVVGDEHCRSLHRDVLDAFDLDTEIVEVQPVQHVPRHLGEDRVEPDRIDVVRGEETLPKQRGPGVEAEPTHQGDRRVVDVAPAMEPADVAAPDDGKTADMAFEADPWAAAVGIDHGRQAFGERLAPRSMPRTRCSRGTPGIRRRRSVDSGLARAGSGWPTNAATSAALFIRERPTTSSSLANSIRSAFVSDSSHVRSIRLPAVQEAARRRRGPSGGTSTRGETRAVRASRWCRSPGRA